ncbi:hypothetical protein DMN91_007323 [Ooceraea biroi]|uniref:RecQ-mediated genome instability protein 1 n=2 Tax=Ooceraea biroi TaxID=2015173 RepID=A0A3L8DJW2_OOCBI|nr:recQ-mediated genome instability protein 1 isoform X1 [Ooceraea biroi]RLU20710.1 hypothetical protein DMN91_007323 [Ooceraea biroi]
MNENLLRRIKGQLNAKFYVMNDIWLRDCVEFFIRDKAPHEMTDRHIFEFVEGQWQLSDLREISNENGCLPRNLTQQMRTVLSGTYILQVDKMYDIASSKYKQLCEIRKVSSENLEVTEKEESEKAEWQPKGRRMMQLCLTDGVQDVTAIEYTPVKQITGTLLPGYKVMIIGPVDCRRGVILLQDGRYKEVGGEVESLLKSNALENVLARALGEPENPDPYNDNGLPRAPNQNPQNEPASHPSGEDSFFDDDFEQAIDLEAVTAIEQQSQEVIEVIQDSFDSTRDRRQIIEEERSENIEEPLQDINFEPLEDWPSNPPTRSLRALPVSRMAVEEFNGEDDIMVEEASTSACNSRSKPLSSANSLGNKSASEFPDDDFDFDDYEMIVEPVNQSQQKKNPAKSGTFSMQSASNSRSANRDTQAEIKKSVPAKAAAAQNKEPMPSTSRMNQEIPKTRVIHDFFKPPPPPPKICDVLSDVLRESVRGRMHRTVRGQVKTHSTLTKQGKCWVLTALIADHTASVEVCFDSELLERFLGFTVQEFSQKRKLCKSNPQINDELRLSLRNAQHQIQSLDALLKLELVQNQTPKVVDITPLTPQQKEALARKPL